MGHPLKKPITIPVLDKETERKIIGVMEKFISTSDKTEKEKDMTEDRTFTIQDFLKRLEELLRRYKTIMVNFSDKYKVLAVDSKRLSLSVYNLDTKKVEEIYVSNYIPGSLFVLMNFTCTSLDRSAIRNYLFTDIPIKEKAFSIYSKEWDIIALPLHLNEKEEITKKIRENICRAQKQLPSFIFSGSVRRSVSDYYFSFWLDKSLYSEKFRFFEDLENEVAQEDPAYGIMFEDCNLKQQALIVKTTGNHSWLVFIGGNKKVYASSEEALDSIDGFILASWIFSGYYQRTTLHDNS